MNDVETDGGVRALCQDLRAECAALDAIVAPLDESGWGLRTRFYGWSIWDEIAHLHLFDEMALLAVGGRDGFRAAQAAIESELASGVQISEYARDRYAGIGGQALLAAWRDGYMALTARVQILGTKDRLPWFGPDMGARSFVTARLMETWAHGQDVCDRLGYVRSGTPRLRHIAHLGVITFGWTFANRGVAAPGEVPYVELTSPSGDRWSWGAPTERNCIRGSALEFCLVVTQRRHYRDTALRAEGRVAEEWLEIAQCFAGPPASGPQPGTFAPSR